MSYYGYPKYVPVAEKQAKAEKKIKQLRKKHPDITPVIIQGSAIATTWWGKEWNKNLERYADYNNRIGRGRSYVRHGAVLDLKIEPGKVKALVQGSMSRPYEVTIDIEKIPNANWVDIKQACKGNMENMQQLIVGKFPKTLAETFTRKGSGLFPAPKEIDFSCSCPDSAYMCKHVAAVLYGIGTRLDSDPTLFFRLRKVNINDLISETIEESKREILSKSSKKTSRVIEDEDSLSELFGIDLGDGGVPQKEEGKKKGGAEGSIKASTKAITKASRKGNTKMSTKASTKTSTKASSKASTKTSTKAGTKTITKGTLKSVPRVSSGKKTTAASAIKTDNRLSSGKKTTAASAIKTDNRWSSGKKTTAASAIKTDNEVILQILKKGKKAMSVADVIAQVDIPDQKVRNILYGFKVQGIVENSERGMYRII
ncbi:MAG: SWIM zinc finger family protein [Desulfamplus sp.]|nr:SWIM zinc finger family protein [Desulfamplus sp.]